MRMMLPPTLRSVSSSTTSLARTSRRSSFPAPSTGSPALQYENIEDFDEGEFEDEDDEDEDELSDDRDEDEESDDEVCSSAVFRHYKLCTNISQNDGTKPKQEAAECKQS
jgi:hypothetical protein